MTDLLATRSQMALPLGFHIIFASIGMAMPFLMAISHRRWIRTGRQVHLDPSPRPGPGAWPSSSPPVWSRAPPCPSNSAALLQPLSGDILAKGTAERQPLKLAAMESHFETMKGAPLIGGGIPDA